VLTTGYASSPFGCDKLCDRVGTLTRPDWNLIGSYLKQEWGDLYFLLIPKQELTCQFFNPRHMEIIFLKRPVSFLREAVNIDIVAFVIDISFVHIL
jgi:hypothetical protein